MPTGALAELRIDLGAVAANWHDLRARHAGGDVAAVVKADGYGLGAVPIAIRLLAEGCRHFFVAHLSEALALRPYVPGAMLAVLNGLPPGAEAEFAAHDVTPVLGTLDEVARWRAVARARDRPLGALLHIDTGMARLGLSHGDVAVLAADPALLARIAVRYVMTHMISAERPDDPLNARQRAEFDALRRLLPAAPTSLANSAGMFLGRDFASDLARPGAALVGINPTSEQAHPLRPVASLRARVLQVRDVPVGGSVGYNATWQAARPSRIAVLGVGYGDGWPVALSNRGRASFDGGAVPLVGRVSMDLTTYDVTDQPGVTPGCWLELIGPNRSLERVAAEAGTLAYAMLTSLGPRYARIYAG